MHTHVSAKCSGRVGRATRLARRATAIILVLASLGLGLSRAESLEQIQYTTLVVSGAAMLENIGGVNDAGQMTVNYLDTTYTPHAALRSPNGTLTVIAFPGAPQTNVFGINNGGQIVGYYAFGWMNIHGFVRDAAGKYTPIDVPGAVFTEALGINDLGQIVGVYEDAAGLHGFMRDTGGHYRSIDSPYATIKYTFATAINDFGQIAGYYYGTAPGSTMSSVHGFLRSADGKTFSVLDYPASPFPYTQLFGLNDLGQVVGFHYTPKVGGFLTDAGGQITPLDVPTTCMYFFTMPGAIDAAGDIVGTYRDTCGIHGFLADTVVAQLPAAARLQRSPHGTAHAIARFEREACGHDQLDFFFDNATQLSGVSAVAVASTRNSLLTKRVIPILHFAALEGLGYDYLGCAETAADPLFAARYAPVFHALPSIPAVGGIPAALATALTDAAAHGGRASAYLQAVAVSLNRYHSALQAHDEASASLQEAAVLDFASQADGELAAFAAGLRQSAALIGGTALDDSVSSGAFLAALERIHSQGAAALPGIERGGFRMFGLDPSYLLTGGSGRHEDSERMSTFLSGALVNAAGAVDRLGRLIKKGLGHDDD